MYAGTLDDPGTPAIELRIYDNELLLREQCESKEQAERIIAQHPGLGRAYLLVHDASPDRGPGDVITREEHPRGSRNDQPIAFQQLPGYGTE